jgi:hypothetical protein
VGTGALGCPSRAKLGASSVAMTTEIPVLGAKGEKGSPKGCTWLIYNEVKVRLDYRWRNCHALSRINSSRGSPSKSRIVDLGSGVGKPDPRCSREKA